MIETKSLFKIQTEQQQNKNEKIPNDTGKMRPYSENLLRISDTVFLHKYDFRKLKIVNDGWRVGIVGATGRGKTSLLRNHILTLPEIYTIPYWVCVNPSEGENRAYKPFFHNDLMIHEETEDIIPAINNFQTRQKAVMKEFCIDDTSFPKKYKVDPNAALIIDDASANQKIFNDPGFGWLYQNSRNARTLAFHLVQYVKTLCPKYRDQLSHLILFGIGSPAGLHKIYQEFGGGCFRDENEFKQAHDIATAGNEVTKEFRCMIIEQYSTSTNIEERVFWYENTIPKEKPKYPKLGAKWFQKYQVDYYNDKWDQNGQMYEPYEAPVKGKKTKGRKILIDE